MFIPKYALLLIFALIGDQLFAQSKKLKLYLDCNCDRNYITQQINYVDHVRDQAMADVHLFITDIGTGNGGRLYDLSFIGRSNYEGYNQIQTLNTTPTATKDEVRVELSQKITLGLIHYLINAGIVEEISEQFGDPQQNEQKQTNLDPWNNWIFEIYGELELERETSRDQFEMEFGANGDKVTEKYRIRTDLELNHSKNEYEQGEDQYLSIRRNYEGEGSVVRSINDHWSTGIFAQVRHDTYRNLDLSYGASPAIEYNIFPYNEVLRREITFSYKIGYTRNRYLESTIYDRMEESLFRHSIDVEMRFRQPWGDISTNLEASALLTDFSKNRIELDSRVSVRVFKGLAVEFSANVESIRDQISLPAGDASLEDILLRQRQIATNFELGTGIGLRYTFGSAFNNIVNTRL